MGFERHIEVGRVAYVAYGPDKGKILAILDVLDQNRALVDGPAIARKQVNFKILHLTKLKVPITRGMRRGGFQKAWEKAEIDKKWQESTWCKKLEATEKKANMGDFDRFKLMKAKQSRNKLINVELGKLKKTLKPKTIKIMKRKAKKGEGDVRVRQVRKFKPISKRKRDLARKAKKLAQKKDAKK